jgi:hypothetical protein
MNKLLLVLCLVLGTKISFCQNMPEKIVAALDSFSFLQPQEKVYLQTDRTSYVAGEPIWFKAYATLNEKPTTLSKIVYVELINASGKLVDKKMLKLKIGTSNAVIDTKSTYETGTYFLRSYTLWMQNFPEFIVEKTITILNASATKTKKAKPIQQEIAVTFYPEGGNLINTVKSIVAFKAVNQNGLPINVKGDIFNNKNEKIASIITTHDGMGKFEILPKEGETYKAVVNAENSKQRTLALPIANKEGVVLSVENTNINKTFVSVARAEKNKEAYNNLLVVAQLNYQVVYMGKLNIDEGLDATAINKKNLPSGIMQITLLTEDGKPLAERIVFVANHKINNTLITANNISTEAKKKNTLSLDLAEYKNLQAGISVTNANSENSSADETIVSSLMLSSDIRGKIHNASTYFVDKETSTINNLDLVMLTNGWRRYKLEDILNHKFSEIKYPFERGMNIIGKVLQSNGKTNLKAGKINLIINGVDSTKIISEATTNSNSAFIVEDIDFKKEATIYYQGTNLDKKNAIVAVNFTPCYFDTLTNPALKDNRNLINIETISINKYYTNILYQKNIDDSIKSKELENVTIKAKKRSVQDSLNTLYATDIFYESDQTIPANTETNAGSIWQFLRVNVPGIVIFNSDTGTMVNFSRYEGANLFGNSTESGVQFFLNEVAVNTNVIETLYAEDIGLVKVFKGNSGITLGATRGAIALYTVKGKTVRDWRKKGFDFIKKLGYSPTREFAAIDYSKFNPQNNFTDTRSTIYWNPSITVKDGKALIDFYNDDVCKKFKIIVEGIDEDGKLLHIEKEME